MPHKPDTIGCLHVDPPLNDVELDFLAELVESGRTLRGTPTGRGRSEVPFARSAWDSCLDGCCLRWEAGMGWEEGMAATLEFIVDHLLRPDAVGAGHPRLAGFTFDHRIDGAVVAAQREGMVLVEVSDNVVSTRVVPEPCDRTGVPAQARPDERAGRRPLPANVIELRPRRA